MKCSGGGVSRKQRHKLYFSFCAHCWRGSRRNVAEIQEWLLILTSTSVKVMAVAVSRDLSVQVLEDQNTVKLTDRQQYLHDAKQCGQSKCIGVSQVVLGLMIMSYAIPLHFINHTEVVYLGVPWWSGLVFITAGVVAIILDKHCTTRTEIPSDRGPPFISQVWKQFCSALDARVSLTSGYHPQTNGQTERMNQELEATLLCLTSDNPAEWSKYLPWVEYAHNSHVSAVTGPSPFEVTLGYQPPLFPADERELSVTSVRHHIRRCKNIWSNAVKALHRSVEQNRKYADR
nr:uncharacterized protein LOC125969396 isoform X2 [Syngnathus scovelli]